MPRKRSLGFRLPRAHGTAAAHSVERRRRHVEHHRAARHRPSSAARINALGIDYNYTRQPFAAWFTIVLMDVWHWTSLVVLLCYAGLVSIPDAYYQAAKVDGARPWAVFRYIQLPKLKYVLTIAILLRFMDSFMIYTEVVVLTGGGPGNATTFLSIDLQKIALGQFDLGPAAAMSIIYFLIILFCQLAVLHADDARRGQVMHARPARSHHRSTSSS